MVSVDTLAKIVNPNQLPSDLHGNLHYDHQMWLDMRLAVEDGLAKANDLLDSYEDVKDQMEDLVTWLEDWKWDGGGGGQPEIHGVDYLKENLQRHTDIRKRIRSETVEQLQALVHTIIQKYDFEFNILKSIASRLSIKRIKITFVKMNRQLFKFTCVNIQSLVYWLICLIRTSRWY